MKIVFHRAAEIEFNEAIDYYETCEPGLGEDFSLSIYTAVNNILAFPQVWPVLHASVRRCIVHRFPFCILYSVEPDRLYVLAVMHLHRHPDYWKQRT